MSRAWLLAALAFALACGAKVKAPAAPLGLGAALVERLDRRATEVELRVAILDGYRLLAQGYDNVYLDTIARDDNVVLFDVGPDEIVVGDATRAAAIRALFPGEEFEIVSKNLEVQLSADGSCAWTYDDLSTRVVRDGRRAIFPLRATSLYERREGRWQKVLEHVSYAATFEEAAARGLLVETRLTDAVPPGDAGARAHDAVTALIAGPPRGAPVADALLIAYDARVLAGPATAELATLRAMFPPNVTLEPAGLRVVTSTSGTVAWAAALFTVRAPGGAFTARATWVLEQRDGELRPVHTHVSVPIAEAALADTVWGGGVAFEPADAG